MRLFFSAVFLFSIVGLTGNLGAQPAKVTFGEPAECPFDGGDGDHHINCIARCPAKSELVSGSCNLSGAGTEAVVLESAGPGTDTEGLYWLCRYVDVKNIGTQKKMSDKVEVTATARCLQ